MKKLKNILYFGWLGQGNIGDDVLFHLFKRMFYENIDRSIYSGEYNIDGFIPNQYQWEMAQYDMVVLGGGSIFNLPYWLTICSTAQELGIPVISWGTGIDGFYTCLSDLYSNSKFFSEDIKKQISEVATRMDYISVRGPLTREFLIKSCSLVNVHEIGDPALFYGGEIVFERNSITEKRVLINWGSSGRNILGEDPERIEEQMEILLQILLNRGYHVTIYPIWIKDIEHVIRLGKKYTENSITIITKVHDGEGIAKLIRNSDFTINLKLHGNILSAAMERPFISLAYRGKCFDFAESVACTDLTISTEEMNAGKVIKMVEMIEKNYKDIVTRFKRAKEKYKPELVNSFDIMFKLLEER